MYKTRANYPIVNTMSVNELLLHENQLGFVFCVVLFCFCFVFHLLFQSACNPTQTVCAGHNFIISVMLIYHMDANLLIPDQKKFKCSKLSKSEYQLCSQQGKIHLFLICAYFEIMFPSMEPFVSFTCTWAKDSYQMKFEILQLGLSGLSCRIMVQIITSGRTHWWTDRLRWHFSPRSNRIWYTIYIWIPWMPKAEHVFVLWSRGKYEIYVSLTNVLVNKTLHFIQDQFSLALRPYTDYSIFG